MTTEVTLRETIAEGVAAAQAVVAAWSEGNLAGAVNNLEGWAEGAESEAAPYNDELTYGAKTARSVLSRIWEDHPG